jgi:hypothetical protein
LLLFRPTQSKDLEIIVFRYDVLPFGIRLGRLEEMVLFVDRRDAAHGLASRVREHLDVILEPSPLREALHHFEFLEWAGENHLRHSRFIGLREDNPASSVTVGIAVAPPHASNVCGMMKGRDMGKLWQRSVPIALFACGCLCVLSGSAAADPIRITATFTVDGGAVTSAISTATFRVLANRKPGHEFTRHSGFGADLVAFTWLGTNWTTANADVVQLGWNADGTLNLWALEGIVPGDGGGMQSVVSPDFSASFCGFCDPGFRGRFLFTTPASASRGIFEGTMRSFSVTQEAATPEPATLFLIVAGGAGFIRRRRRELLYSAITRSA